jgi:hypothetical protein
MGNKLLQARCHILNERILTSENQLGHARQASDIALRLYQDADLLCTICQKPMGMLPDHIQILTCTHIFHERYERNIEIDFNQNNHLFRCILNLLEKWTNQAQSCPKCHKSVLYSRSYIALSCS